MLPKLSKYGQSSSFKPKKQSWYEKKVRDAAPTKTRASMTVFADGFSMDKISVKQLVDDLREYLDNAGVTQDIVDVKNFGNKLHQLKEKYFWKWVANIDVPRLRHTDIPEDYRRWALSLLWSNAIREIRGASHQRAAFARMKERLAGAQEDVTGDNSGGNSLTMAMGQSERAMQCHCDEALQLDLSAFVINFYSLPRDGSGEANTFSMTLIDYLIPEYQYLADDPDGTILSHHICISYITISVSEALGFYKTDIIKFFDCKSGGRMGDGDLLAMVLRAAYLERTHELHIFVGTSEEESDIRRFIETSRIDEIGDIEGTIMDEAGDDHAIAMQGRGESGDEDLLV